MCGMRNLFRALAVVGVVAVASAQTPQAPHFAVLIRSARVLDGTGNPWMRADIGIRDGRIVSVGRLGAATADTVIDAADRLVTPGFIDVHSHALERLARNDLRHAKPLVAQGVTTIVGNPDGAGPVDLAAQRAALEKAGLGLNTALLIGHGSVRTTVMRDRQQRDPTAAELDEMRALVRRGMEQGAFGLSSGLFYTPGSFAKTEEVIALASVAGELGGVYTSHIRDEGNYDIGVVRAVDEVIRIAEEGHVVGIVSHMKALGPENWGLSMASTQRIDRARARGVSVFADQYPYEASVTSLRAALLPGGLDAMTASPAVVRDNIRRRGGADAILIAAHAPDRTMQGKTLAQIAQSRGVAPETAAIDMLQRGSTTIISFNMSEDDIRHIMTRSYTMASSDGALAMTGGTEVNHPRDNGAFSRRLAVYVRERRVVSIEFAVRSMTSLPASVFGMTDRGVIREGAIADIAIFNLEDIRDRATYKEPQQLAEGMAWVLVNGVPVVANGAFTNALPGKVLRRNAP
jgi:N-acyl-D-amino-acid deacylase